MFFSTFVVNVMFAMLGPAKAIPGNDFVLTSDPETPRARLEYTKGILFLGLNSFKFTACIRVNLPHAQNQRVVSLISYSSKVSGVDNEILLQANYEDGQTVLYISDNYDFAGVDKVPGLDKWSHVCVSWDGVTGKVQFYLDGEPSGEGETGKGKVIGTNGFLVLGQDQDAYDGGYDPDKGVTGRITQFHFWERILSPEEVKKVEKCELTGDLVNWDDSVWGLSGHIQVAQSTAPCGQTAVAVNDDPK